MMKDELIKAAGDLEQSKARVIHNVLNAKPKKRKPLVPLFITATVLCLALLMPNLLPKQSYSEPELVDYYSVLNALKSDSAEQIKHAAIEQLMKDEALLAFAEAKGVHVTETDITAQQEQLSEYFSLIEGQAPDVFATHGQALQTYALSERQFHNFIMTHYSRVQATRDAVRQIFTKKYAEFDPFFVEDILKTESLLYFRAHHLPRLAELEKTWKQSFPDYHGTPLDGIVIYEHEHAFLLATGYTGDDTKGAYNSDSRLAYWIPKLDGWDVQVGDTLRLQHNMSMFTENTYTFYQSAALAQKMQPLDEPLKMQLGISLPALAPFTDSVTAPQQPSVRIYTPDASYKVWPSADRELFIVQQQGLNKTFAITPKELKELLQ